MGLVPLGAVDGSRFRSLRVGIGVCARGWLWKQGVGDTRDIKGRSRRFVVGRAGARWLVIPRRAC